MTLWAQQEARENPAVCPGEASASDLNLSPVRTARGISCQVWRERERKRETEKERERRALLFLDQIFLCIKFQSRMRWVQLHTEVQSSVSWRQKVTTDGGCLLLLERMKAVQKNQGRTDQMLGAMADVLTSVAMPNQQWVSCSSLFAYLLSV